MNNILRIIGEGELISAKVFENNFKHAFGSVFNINYSSISKILKQIFESHGESINYETSACNFLKVTKGFDFLCPAFEAFSLIPLLICLRNTSRSSIRLLFIAHSPGVYPLDWALLRPILARGDLIIAPSKCAQKAISFLCPELDPYVKMIHHPIPVPQIPRKIKKNPAKIKIITLSRIDENKLIHRQIEAMGILKQKGYQDICMYIAGPLDDVETGKETIYVRCLIEKIIRFRLEEQVKLVGLIVDDIEKNRFISQGDISVNLSSTIEEAFPKASIEPLFFGIPVISTKWNGFTETIGEGGLLIDFHELSPGVLDVSPQKIANAILQLINHPIPADICIKQARKFTPEVSIKNYKKELKKAMQYNPAEQQKEDMYYNYTGGISESRGLIGNIAFLKPFTWKQMIEYNIEAVEKQYLSINGKTEQNNYTELYFRTFLLHAVKNPLQYLYAGKSTDKWTHTSGNRAKLYNKKNDFRETMKDAVDAESVLSAREALLSSFYYRKDVDLLQEALEKLTRLHLEIPNKHFFEIGLLYQKKEYSKAYSLFNDYYDSTLFNEFDSDKLKLFAQICRKCCMNDSAIQVLSKWLEVYPDSPASPYILLELVVACFYVKKDFFVFQENFAKLKKFMEKHPAVIKIEKQIFGNTC